MTGWEKPCEENFCPSGKKKSHIVQRGKGRLRPSRKGIRTSINRALEKIFLGQGLSSPRGGSHGNFLRKKKLSSGKTLNASLKEETKFYLTQYALRKETSVPRRGRVRKGMRDESCLQGERALGSRGGKGRLRKSRGSSQGKARFQRVKESRDKRAAEILRGAADRRDQRNGEKKSHDAKKDHVCKNHRKGKVRKGPRFWAERSFSPKDREGTLKKKSFLRGFNQSPARIFSH